MNRDATSGILLSACAVCTATVITACGPAPELPAAHTLEQCAADLRRVPAVFEKARLPGFAVPPIDLKAVATAECIDATSARHLAELEVRADRANLAVADYAVPPARRWWEFRPSPDEARVWQAHLAAGRRDLVEARVTLDKTLEGLYRAAPARSVRGVDEYPLVAVALFDYSRLVRELLGERFHTRVVRLDDFAFCRGDIVGSRLLWRYFEAAVRSRGGDRDATADAVRALREIALQTACLGNRQLFELDAALSLAWVELEQRLDRLGMRRLLPTLEPAVFQVRLIVFDASKHFGRSSPAFRWWVTRTDLRERLRKQANWPIEELLWLYDRRSGAMAAVKPTCRDGGSGIRCLNLSVFAESLARPSAFGMAECSFLEMIEGGIRNVKGAPSYTCTPGLCGTANRSGRIPDTRLAASFPAAFKSAGPGYVLPKRAGQTPFGVPVDEARGLLCGGASGGGLDGRDGSAGMSGPGMGAASGILACVVGPLADRTASLAPRSACIGRVVQAASPSNTDFEKMATMGYAGVPKVCGLADEDGSSRPASAGDEKKDGGTDKPVEQQIQDAARKLAEELKSGNAKVSLDSLKSAVKNATGMSVADEDVKTALDSLANAKTGDAAPRFDENAKLVLGTTTPDGQVMISIAGWVSNLGQGDKNTDTLLHEFVHALTDSAESGRQASFEQLGELLGGQQKMIDYWEQVDQKAMATWGLPKNDRCVADDSACNNRCNGMSTQTQEAIACLDEALSPKTIPPRPIDLVADPIDPEGAKGAQMAACFKDTGDILGVIAARECTAVRCANPSAGYTLSGCCQTGGLVAESGFGDRNKLICAVARCDPSPVRSAVGVGIGGDLGVCGCGGSYAPTLGSGPIVSPPEVPFSGLAASTAQQ